MLNKHRGKAFNFFAHYFQADFLTVKIFCTFYIKRTDLTASLLIQTFPC